MVGDHLRSLEAEQRARVRDARFRNQRSGAHAAGRVDHLIVGASSGALWEVGDKVAQV